MGKPAYETSQQQRGITIVALKHLVDKIENGKIRFAVIDFETNGLERGTSILAWTGIFGSVAGIPPTWSESTSVTRYYLPSEPLNREALRCHGLTEKRIRALRHNVAYPECFYDDVDAGRLLVTADLMVSHNAVFDSAFVSEHAKHVWFCTMRASVTRVRRQNPDGSLRFPSLADTAEHFGVAVDDSRLHTSEADARLTAAVFRALVERAAVRRSSHAAKPDHNTVLVPEEH